MNKFSYKQIVVFFLGGLLTIIIYIGVLAHITHNTNKAVLSNAEPWVKDIYIAKDIINNMPTMKQRIIVMGGSSSLFGFNGAMIEANTNFRFINYGTHAGLPLNYQIDRIMQHLKNNDILFLPIEFGAYTLQEPTQNYWYIHNMLTWEKTYRKYIGIKQEVLSYFSNDFLKSLLIMLRSKTQENEAARFIKGHIKKDKNYIKIPNINSKKIILVPCENENWSGYNYKSISATGDFCSQNGSFVSNMKSSYLEADLQISEYFLQEYQRLKQFAESKNIKIFLIYPPTMENPLFSLKDRQTFAKIENLTLQLAKYDIKIYGDFTDFHFNSQYFYDTEYHLNAQGAQLRTANFIKLLHQLTNENSAKP